MTNDKKLMKSGKAAEYLGVPHRTFQFWVKTRKLIPDVVTNGGHYFFSEENLARFKGTEEKTRNENSQNAQYALLSSKPFVSNSIGNYMTKGSVELLTKGFWLLEVE